MMPKMGNFYPRLGVDIGPRQTVAGCQQISAILGKSFVIHLAPIMALFGS